MSLPSRLQNSLAERRQLANHDSKEQGRPELVGKNTVLDDPTRSTRSTWSQRLELFTQPAAETGASGAGAAASEWEHIRSTGALTNPVTDPLAPHLPDPDPLGRRQGNGEELELSLGAARREIADREAENVGLRGALGAAHQQLRAREAEIADLTTRLAVANATTHARQDELEALGGRYSGAEEKLNVHEREIRIMHDKLQRAAETAEKRETKLENLRTTRATLEETLAARERVIHARDEELGAIEQELQSVRDRVSAHQKSIADRESEMALLNDQLLASQERARTLEAEIGGREHMVAHQREKLVQRDEQLASLLATLDVVERTVASRPEVLDLSAQPAVSTHNGWQTTPPTAAAPMITEERLAPAPAAPAIELQEPSRAEARASIEEDFRSPAPSTSTPEPEPSIRPDLPESNEPEEELAAAPSPPFVDQPEDDAESEMGEQPEAEPPLCTDEETDEPEAVTAAADQDGQDEAGAMADEDTDENEVVHASDGDDGADAAAEQALPVDAESDATVVISPADFEHELHVLEASGDLLSQRPAPQPTIFRWWRDNQIATRIPSPDINSFDDLLVDTIARECAERSDQTISVWSLCGADPELELRIATALVANGHSNFAIDCYDDRASWHEIRADLAEASDLADKIDSLPASVASLKEDQQYDVFIANGSMASVADLPALFEWLQKVWKEDSVMVLGEVLGTSATATAPENIETIDRIWNVMSDRYMHNHLTGEEQATYAAPDSPSDARGIGGPLSPGATSLLPLLLDSFCFEVFAAFGNLINAFVGAEIGPNFDPRVESDCSFIERFAKLDEAQIDAGAIHPVHMAAVLRTSSAAEAIMLENRAPERCLMLDE